MTLQPAIKIPNIKNHIFKTLRSESNYKCKKGNKEQLHTPPFYKYRPIKKECHLPSQNYDY